MREEEVSLTIEHPQGFPISAILAQPKNPTRNLVILCHGFLSNKNSTTNQRLTELLLPQGISTLRFDWEGMGESGGTFKTITLSACLAQLCHLINRYASEGFQHIGLIGSSFGGLVCILAAARYPHLQVLGLKCPVPDFPEMLNHEFGKEAMRTWESSGTIPNLLGGTDPLPLHFSFYEDCCRFNAYEQAQSIRIPTCIVHGTKDELVPIRQIHSLEQALACEEKDIHLIKDANHHFARPEDFRTMTVLLANWITRHLAHSPDQEPVKSGEYVD